MKKKAGIVTIYDVPNFGSVLQAYSTSYILEQLGFSPYFIKYDRYNKWVISHGGIQKQPLLKRIISRLGIKRLHRKINRLSSFKKKYFKETKLYVNLEELQKEDWRDFDLFVIGSDQVWNPRFCYGDSFYMLSFVPIDKRKISIASSFAVSEIPEEFKAKYRKHLSNIDAFSVREQNAIHIINEQLHIKSDVKIMLDPTLLLSKEQWNSIAETSNNNEPYILLYMWDYAFNPHPYFEDVAKYFHSKLKYKIIVLEDSNKKININDTDIENKVDSTIPQFLRLFSKASLVITTSFHGTAFALNYGRPLISIIPGNGDDRQMSLLRSLNVPQCAVEINSTLDSITPYYDAEEEQRLLDLIRQDNIQWIKRHTR